MEREREGFPVTSLREMNIMLAIDHPYIVQVWAKPLTPDVRASDAVRISTGTQVLQCPFLAVAVLCSTLGCSRSCTCATPACRSLKTR